MKNIYPHFQFCLIALFSLAFYAKAQNGLEEKSLIEKCIYFDSHNLDSLRIILALNQNTNNIEDSYRQYFRARISDDDSTEKVLLEGIIKNESEIKDRYLIGQTYYRIGRILSANGAFDSALLNYEKAINLFNLATPSFFNAQNKICVVNTSQAYISNQLSDFEKAIEYSLSSLSLAEKYGFDDLKLVSFLNLSASYGELSSPDNRLSTKDGRNRYSKLSKEYMFKAANLAKQLNDRRRLHRTYGNIGIFYTYENMLDSAIFFLQSAILIGEEIGDKRGLANDHNMLALVYQKQNMLGLAEEQSEKAMQYAKLINAERMQADILLSLAEVSILKKEYKRAKLQLFDAIEIAEKLKVPKITSNAYNMLSEVAKQEGGWRDAYSYFEKSIISRDSVANQENFDRIEELRTEYETEKKERQIELLQRDAELADLEIKQQRIFLFVSALILAVISLALYFYLKNRSLNLSRQRLLTEHKLLRSQMNPHFIFNTLSAIQTFIYQKANPMVTADYLGKFSQLTRMILDNSREEYISLQQEVDFIDKYIELQQLRFDEPFKFDLIIDENINLCTTFMPPMLTQPFIENSIEHGILTKLGNGKIEVGFRIFEENLEITIIDNGIGREAAAFEVKNKKHRSLALKITEERLQMIKKPTSLKINDRINANMVEGTEVRILIPVMEG